MYKTFKLNCYSSLLYWLRILLLLLMLPSAACSSLKNRGVNSLGSISWSAIEVGGAITSHFVDRSQTKRVSALRSYPKSSFYNHEGRSYRDFIRQLRTTDDISRLSDFNVFEDGVIADRGGSKTYFGPTATLPTNRQVYWLMVKILSKKYGCFITAKSNYLDTTAFRCRDQRRILLTSQRYDDWTVVRGRQYDARGFEIAVQNRRIVRTGGRRSEVESLF